MPKKCILILLDGIGDRPHGELENKTPLQAACTPVLDKIAADGASGLYHAGITGQALPSENAHFSLFGYDLKDFPGRGALEALGAGIPLDKNDVAILSHFVSLVKKDGVFRLKQNKPVLSEQEALSFFSIFEDFEVNEITLKLLQTHGFKGIVKLSGPVSPFITDTDPFIDHRLLIEPKPWKQYSQDINAGKTAAALKKFILYSHDLLKKHPFNEQRKKENKPPVNGIVTQRAGRLKNTTRFNEKYGLNGCVLASGLVYQGLAKYLGMAPIRVKDTDNPGDDLAGRIELAYQKTGEYDFIHVHTKVPDEMAHTKNPIAKKQAIEALDEGMGRAVRPLLNDPDIFLIIAADHSTPSSGPLIHSGEPVPVIFHGDNVRRDFITTYDEIHAAQGILGHLRRKEIMYLILNHLDKSKLAGIRDCPEDQPFWPGRYEPFKTGKN